MRHRNAVAVRYLPTLYGEQITAFGGEFSRIFVQTEPNELVQTDRFILRLHDIAQVQSNIHRIVKNNIYNLPHLCLLLFTPVCPLVYNIIFHGLMPAIPTGRCRSIESMLYLLQGKTVLQHPLYNMFVHPTIPLA